MRQNWLKKPVKCCTKIKPALDTLCPAVDASDEINAPIRDAPT